MQTKTFKQKKESLEKALQEYKANKTNALTYSQSMKNISAFLESKKWTL